MDEPTTFVGETDRQHQILAMTPGLEPVQIFIVVCVTNSEDGSHPHGDGIIKRNTG